MTADHPILVEHLHRAYKAQAHYAQDHPQVRLAMEALLELLQRLLEEQPSLEVSLTGHSLLVQGIPVEGTPNATAAVLHAFAPHGITSLTFFRGLSTDDLNLLLFLLQLRPQRLADMGGLEAMLPEGHHLRLMTTTGPVGAEAMPAPPAEPRSPRSLAEDLSGLLFALTQMTAAPLRPDPRAPWTRDQREALEAFGFMVADLGGLSGMGEQLGLGDTDPQTLRQAARTALLTLEPVYQASLLLSLPTCPAEEVALRRAFDYLAPEILAQTLGDVMRDREGSRTDLALAAAAMLHCVKDRDLAIEALKGRLMLEGWSMDETDQLQEAILWECQGTDTKLRLSLVERRFFELDAQQLATLVRQLARSHKTDGLKDLLDQVEVGFSSPHLPRRHLAAGVLVDLAECLEDPGLPPELVQRLHAVLHTAIATDEDPQILQWACQGMETLLGHWMTTRDFGAVYAETLALGEYLLAGRAAGEAKTQAIRGLLARLASPDNLDRLLPMLVEPEQPATTTPRLHALLTLLGRPAAQHLALCLELETVETRRTRLQDALRAIGRNAVPALLEALASPQPAQVAAALQLLTDIHHIPAFSQVVLALGHRDLAVRRAAVRAVAALGSPHEVCAALCALLPTADPATQLDALSALGPLRQPEAVLPLVQLIAALKGATGDAARVRLRAIEALGLMGSDSAIPALQDLFKKRGILGSREGSAVRLAAVKALETLATREARETLALVLDQENDDDVRLAIRKVLVG